MSKKNQHLWDSVYKEVNLPWTKNPIPFNLLTKFLVDTNTTDIILDYGCGNGYISLFFYTQHKRKVLCADISSVALRTIKEMCITQLKTIHINNPYELRGKKFKRIFVWGVMHHIDQKEWSFYLECFFDLLDENGIILIGGHSNKDRDFKKGYRLSPTTNSLSYSVDSLIYYIKDMPFKIIEYDYFKFEEAFTNKKRFFKYFILKKE